MWRDHQHPSGARLVVTAVVAVALLVPFGLLAALVVGDIGWLHRMDARITEALHGFAHDNPGWVGFMEFWSLAFDPNVWRVAGLVLVVWLYRRGARDVAVWVAVTMLTGGVLNAVLKLIFERHRPEFLDPVAQAAGYSFPSGHALNNAVGAAVFLLVLLPVVRNPAGRAALWAAAIVIPLLTAGSRVLLGVHWTSDVVAGLLLGVAVVAVSGTALLARRRRRVRPELAQRA